ncbi:aminotransferase class V-fold PLP-dependent enzyme [Dyella telluris]|uniref:Aminotransferase class V-fold PLP-dependent enzyme n=1 Tax=Dyella telluris TaxID=2763498 RepID=A0A7G8Q5I3_9GAMM|nr:aminotransferase class V-fold PLP-dependent enzyme [Dyella telluris]QNK02041.1 aminotransferase class V-fold PLP-dependent enzyme [Dyella telluris]
MSHLPSPLLPREWFDMPAGVYWFSHCKDGPLPRASAAAVRALMETELRPWEVRWSEDFLDVQRSLRQVGATLLGVVEQDISLVTCTSSGLEAVALGYPWQDGDEVLLPLGEFPSNRLPWLALARRGVDCREVPLWEGQAAPVTAAPVAGMTPEQRLLEAIGPRTRIMAVSWVRYQDGVRLDLEKLGRGCRERGVHLVVDGIQGAGTMVASFEGVSAFATGGHKGLLGLQGQGLLWTDPAFRQQLLPLGTWLSAPDDFSQGGTQSQSDELWAADGRRLEAGSPSILSCAALASSLRLLVECGGTAALQRHIVSLQRALLSRLAQDARWAAEAARLDALVRADQLGSTLSFALPTRQSDELLRTAQMHGISTSTREGYLRIAFHGWHGATDVERCAAWLLGTA